MIVSNTFKMFIAKTMAFFIEICMFAQNLKGECRINSTNIDDR